MDEETRAHIIDIRRMLGETMESVQFLMDLESPTLLIQAKMAYVLERVANRVFDLDEFPDEPSVERITKAFAEIRALLDEHQQVMKKYRDLQVAGSRSGS